NNTSAWKKGVDLEIRHYGTTESATQLYDDDGKTFNYENGAYSWYSLEAGKNNLDNLVGTITKTNGNCPESIGDSTWKFMTN
ncbi:MAG: DUF5110 domain-containing protein, partial [Candidatus Hydrogenedentota bacterium]